MTHSTPRDPSPKAVNIDVSEDLKARLEAYAKDLGMSQAAAVRVALDDFLTRAGYPRTERTA